MAEFILKDWYGKDCRFNHDTIFVQDVNGELVQFTQGKGESVLESLEVTENGTYTPNEGVDGFDSVTVDVPIPEVVLQDKTITENGTYSADSGYDGLGSVIVDVKGSGGGSLPVGGYWKPENSIKPSTYQSHVFVYNGKRYLYTLNDYQDTKYDIYLLEDDAYTLVATDVYNRHLSYCGVVEYNGKMHFIGYDMKYHHIWDGSSAAFVTCANLPAIACNDSAFVMDGDLFIKTTSSGFYKWIEDSDTWESVAVVNCPTTSYESLVVIGRKIYIVGYAKIYEVDWDAKTCTTIETNIPKGVSGKGCAVALNGYIYFVNGGSYTGEFCGVYKYDISNKSYAVVTGLHEPVCLYVYNGRIYGEKKGHFHQSLYEVTE